MLLTGGQSSAAAGAVRLWWEGAMPVACYRSGGCLRGDGAAGALRSVCVMLLGGPALPLQQPEPSMTGVMPPHSCSTLLLGTKGVFAP